MSYVSLGISRPPPSAAARLPPLLGLVHLASTVSWQYSLRCSIQSSCSLRRAVLASLYLFGALQPTMLVHPGGGEGGQASNCAQQPRTPLKMADFEGLR